MLQPYEDSKKKMTDGVHPLSQQVGDHNFQKHKKIKAEVAESWRESHTTRMTLVRRRGGLPRYWVIKIPLQNRRAINNHPAS